MHQRQQALQIGFPPVAGVARRKQMCAAAGSVVIKQPLFQFVQIALDARERCREILAPQGLAAKIRRTAIHLHYTALQRFLDDADKYDLRLDAQWTPRTSSFLRLSQSKEYAVDGPSLPEPLDGAVNGKQRIINQQVALGLTRQIGAAQLLEFRLGASYTKGGKYTAAIDNTRTFGIP